MRVCLHAEHGAGVFDKQWFDVIDVAADLVVVGALAECHQGAGDDVDEAPGEFFEGGRVALARQLIGDAGGDLGDAGEVADGVVAHRGSRVAEVKHHEVLCATALTGLGVDAFQEIGIALRVEDDHDVAAADVLRNQELGQPCLADPRGAQHQGVPHPLLEIHPHRLFVVADAVQGAIAAERRQWRERIAAASRLQASDQPGQHRFAFPGRLDAARPAIQSSRADVSLHLGAKGVAQSLCVLLAPAKTSSEEELVSADRDLVVCQAVAWQLPEAALIAPYPPGLVGAPRGKTEQARRHGVGDAGRHHQSPGRGGGDRGGRNRGQHRPELDQRSQQGVDHVATHCQSRVAVMQTG